MRSGVSRRSPLHFPTYADVVLGPETSEKERAARDLPVPSEAKVAEEVAALWKSGQREAWGEILHRSMLKPAEQFEIKPEKIMKHARYYGAVVIDKKRIVGIMNQYSSQLREKVIPIYTELARLTNELNKFYLADDINAGPRAADHAKTLKDEVTGAVEKE